MSDSGTYEEKLQVARILLQANADPTIPAGSLAVDCFTAKNESNVNLFQLESLYVMMAQHENVYFDPVGNDKIAS